MQKWFNLKDLPINTTAVDCEKNFRKCTNNANFEYFRMSRSFSQDSQIMAEAKATQDRALEWCRVYIGCVNN